MGSRILFHFHTSYSYDANIATQQVVDFAVANNITILSPTDHDTIQGALELRKMALEHGITTIIGAEYLSDRGDIIGLFLEDEVRAKEAEGVIREIRNQGGIAILPHPYRSHELDDEFVRNFDGIEVFNARLSSTLNDRSRELACRLMLPQFFGADAHLTKELGLAIGEIDDLDGQPLRQAVKRGMKPIVTKQTRLSYIYRSQMSKALQTQRPWLWVKSLAKMLIVGLLRKTP